MSMLNNIHHEEDLHCGGCYGAAVNELTKAMPEKAVVPGKPLLMELI